MVARGLSCTSHDEIQIENWKFVLDKLHPEQAYYVKASWICK